VHLDAKGNKYRNPSNDSIGNPLEIKSFPIIIAPDVRYRIIHQSISVLHQRQDMSDKPLVIIGADWCGDCRRAKHLLDQHKIHYQWIDIDQDEEAEQVVLKINKGFRSIPTILFNDGSSLVEPSNAVLATKLGLLN
jgi:mycoredoxin